MVKNGRLRFTPQSWLGTACASALLLAAHSASAGVALKLEPKNITPEFAELIGKNTAKTDVVVHQGQSLEEVVVTTCGPVHENYYLAIKAANPELELKRDEPVSKDIKLGLPSCIPAARFEVATKSRRNFGRLGRVVRARRCRLRDLRSVESPRKRRSGHERGYGDDRRGRTRKRTNHDYLKVRQLPRCGNEVEQGHWRMGIGKRRCRRRGRNTPRVRRPG